jgi:hypothetical protein
MAEDIVRKSGSPHLYDNDRGQAKLITEPVIGIVKNNIDPTRSGRIDVYISNFGGSDPDDSSNWVRGIRYLSPFFGLANPNHNPYEGPDKSGLGKYVGNPHSYGFWASAPDLGTEVLCIFVDGKPSQGFYIGCIPKPGLHFMVPAIGAANYVIPNSEEAKTYGGADRLPVVEVNYTNPAIQNSPTIYSEPKPVHSYQAAILNHQGLIRDNIRGVISSSSQRETPSKVFGFSTPGGPIYSGGYTDQNIEKALEEDPSKLQVIGRRGGHSLVMDDGTIDGQDQLLRLRTSAGHMILMSDSGQTLFIVHSNGQSWIELGKEGTIDMYSANSVNIRTQGDLNLHADRDININAKRNLNVFADAIKEEAEKTITQRSGQGFQGYHIGKYTLKVDGPMSFKSSGDSSFDSDAITYINGSLIKLNSGTAPTVPQQVKEFTKVNYSDTVFSPSKGWITPGPNPLLSIASRITTHYPYLGVGLGVDVKIAQAESSSVPTPSATLQVANASAPSVPLKPITSGVVSTTNKVAGVKINDKEVISADTVAATFAQNGASASQLTATQAKNQGVLQEINGLTIEQLSNAGPNTVLKPGTADFILEKLKTQNLPLACLIPKNNFTGNLGITTLEQLKENASAQSTIFSSNLQQAATALTQAGIVNGTESATQITGVVNAAAVAGADVLSDALANPTGNQSVTQSITNGNFASSLVDKAKNFSLSDTISGIAAGATKTISSLTAQLQSTGRKIYSFVESSFTNLSANKPNVLGNSGASSGSSQNEADGYTQAYQKIETAQIELTTAQSMYDEARIKYKNSPSMENLKNLQTSEQALTAAKQKISQASESAFSFYDKANSSSTSTSTSNSGNSGINALSGGLGGAVSVITNGVKSAVGATIDVIKGIPSGFGISGETASAALEKLKNPAEIVGNIFGNLKDAFVKVGTGIGDNLKTQASSIGESLSSIGKNIEKIAASGAGLFNNIKSSSAAIANNSDVKAPIMASNTVDSATQTAKASALLGDNRVPPPIFTEIPVTFSPNMYLEMQSSLQKELTSLRSQRELKKIEVDNLVDAYIDGKNVQTLELMNQKQKELEAIDAKISLVQNSFEKLLESKS